MQTTIRTLATNMNKPALHPALRDLLRPVEPESSGIRMDGIGCWSCARLGLRGYGTLHQLKNAMAKKQAKLAK